MSNEPDQTPEIPQTPPVDGASPTPASEPTPASSPAPAPGPASAPGTPGAQIPGSEKKMVAGILGILLGGLGIHKFYLGYTKEGVIQLVGGIVLTVITCGFGAIVPWAIGLVEGVMYLTKTDEEFVNTYVTGQKPWF